MKVKYDSSKNNVVLSEFIKFISKNYLIPLILNVFIGFILFFIVFNGFCRCLYEGYFSLRLYEVLLIPMMIIPIVNSLQAITIISICVKKIDKGNYFVNRYKYLGEKKGSIMLSSNEFYPKMIISDNNLKNIGNNIDIISITNNYGARILMFGIAPEIKKIYVSEKYPIEVIFQKNIVK